MRRSQPALSTSVWIFELRSCSTIIDGINKSHKWDVTSKWTSSRIRCKITSHMLYLYRNMVCNHGWTISLLWQQRSNLRWNIKVPGEIQTRVSSLRATWRLVCFKPSVYFSPFPDYQITKILFLLLRYLMWANVSNWWALNSTGLI